MLFLAHGIFVIYCVHDWREGWSALQSPGIHANVDFSAIFTHSCDFHGLFKLHLVDGLDFRLLNFSLHFSSFSFAGYGLAVFFLNWRVFFGRFTLHFLIISTTSGWCYHFLTNLSHVQRGAQESEMRAPHHVYHLCWSVTFQSFLAFFRRFIC